MKHTEELRRELHPTEELRWSESPSFWRELSVADLFGGCIVLAMFTGMSFTIEDRHYRSIMTVFFALAGIAAAIGRFWRACTTVYGVTDRRVIILQSSLGEVDARSLYSWNIRYIRKKRKSSGCGNIIFTDKPGAKSSIVEIGFFGIRNVDHVARLVEQLGERGIQTERTDDAKKA